MGRNGPPGQVKLGLGPTGALPGLGVVVQDGFRPIGATVEVGPAMAEDHCMNVSRRMRAVAYRQFVTGEAGYYYRHHGQSRQTLIILILEIPHSLFPRCHHAL